MSTVSVSVLFAKPSIAIHQFVAVTNQSINESGFLMWLKWQ